MIAMLCECLKLLCTSTSSKNKEQKCESGGRSKVNVLCDSLLSLRWSFFLDVSRPLVEQVEVTTNNFNASNIMEDQHKVIIQK